jgi:formylmethanofuran dehydrogenase subunit B
MTNQSQYGLVHFEAGLNYVMYNFEPVDKSTKLFMVLNNEMKEIGTLEDLRSYSRNIGTSDVYSSYQGYLGDVRTLNGKVYINKKFII